MYYNLAIIGFPLKHTLSPTLHSFFLHKVSLNGGYCAFETDKNAISEVIDIFKRYNFTGFNITVPYKNEIIKYLDFIDANAEAIGAVNTVLIKNDLLYGYNTDTYGFEQLIETNNLILKNKDIFILGSGDSTKTVLTVLKKYKYNKILIFARDTQKAKSLIKTLNIVNSEVLPISFLNNLNECDIIINTTSIGLKGENFLDLSNVICKYVAIDLQYAKNQTSFLKEFDNNICKVDGLAMLIYQGYKAFNLWTDTEFTFSIDEIIKWIGVN